MSRATAHCACRNSHSVTEETQKVNSRAYSMLPNYNNKLDNNRQSTKYPSSDQNHSVFSKNKYLCPNRNDSEIKNYENIEYCTSGLFRPHSCPADDNDVVDRTNSPTNHYHESTLRHSKTHMNKPQENPKPVDKYQRKYSKSNTKPHQKTGNVGNLKSTENPQADKHYFDSKYLDYNAGLNFYTKNSHDPLSYGPESGDTRLGHSVYKDERAINHSFKKPSCGLKYIIFQKLSIMTHFITGSKHKKSSPTNKANHLSTENLFKDKSPRTKRSRSYHNLDNSHSHNSGCKRCDNSYKSNSIRRVWKPKMSKTRLSNLSNSSSGSIDAHAGSPITIMTTVCGNILANGSNPMVSNTFCHSSKTKWKNDEKVPDQNPLIKENHVQRNQNQHRDSLNNQQTNQSKFGQNINNGIPNLHSCSNCSCSTQPACIPMPYDQSCRHQCCNQSHIQPPPQSCHYCCCNHSHVVMHPSYSPSPYMCCSPSNFLHHCSITKPICLHSFFPCNTSMLSNENCTQPILCSSCQAKNVDRCQSANLSSCNKVLSNNLNLTKQPQNLYASAQKYRSKPDNRIRNFRHSPVNHSKPTSIPPPPPPPPSSLYSTKEFLSYKPKQKRRNSNKTANNGKVCTRCSEKMTVFNQESSDNVQNIIYSHLNNTVACQSTKVSENSDLFPDNKNLTTNSENRLKFLSKNISWNSSNEKSEETTSKNPKNDYLRYNSHDSYSSKDQAGCLGNVEESLERRSAEIYNRRSSVLTPSFANHKPRFISKTPETYKSKNDRRQKNHQGEAKRILKHKSICITREYNYIDQDSLCKNDSVDSPEVGSFIFSPVSPLIKKTATTVAICNLSSFNIHQQHFNLKDKRNNNSEPARKAFQENMLSLREVGWYWGPLSFTEAERLMENKANGTFLVRDSGHDTYFLSLTFRVRETTYHTRIEYSQGTFSFWSQPESHSATTISEFIDKAVAHSQSGKFHYFLLTNVPGQPPMEVSLLYPLTRNQIVHSLKHLARFVILSNIRKDHISNLNIPSPLKLYLLEKQYYISNFDQFIECTMDAHPLNYKPSILTETIDK